MPEQPKSHFDRFMRPLLASRFITISAVLHLLIVVLFGSKRLYDAYVQPPDFEASSESAAAADAAPAPPPAPDVTLPQEPSVSTAPPPPPSAPASALNMIVANSTSPSSFSAPMPVLTPASLSRDITTQPTVAQTISPGSALPGLPGVMSKRGAGGREQAGQKYKEHPAAEQAVLKALRWLQSQQSTGGTWGTSNKGGMTGLALLCFLGHGETPEGSHEFGTVVSNGINALLAEGAKNDGRLSFGNEFSGNGAVYQHAICTYALCEAYTMTKNEKLVPLVSQAVSYIIKGQRPNGGWAYSYNLDPNLDKGKDRSDTSVSGWQIQALKAAHLTGLSGMDAIPQVLDNAMKNLDRVFNPKNGSFGYRVAGDRDYSLTGVGVLSKLFWQGREDRNVREGIKDIQSREVKYESPDANLYAWYYDTQACFQAQGGAWEWWNKRFQDELISRQAGDGSWPPTGGKDHTGPIADTGGDGPVYRTTLCCLMLEVFYRYLPTSQDNGGGGGIQGL